MRRSSGRGQVEPLAALAAVLAVSAGFVVYADTFEETTPEEPDDQTPSAIVDAVQRSLQSAGVASPARLDAATTAVPSGWEANVTLAADGTRWQRGPAPPASADRVSRRVSVRVAPRRIQPGQLRVVVWR
ncbi:DUF7285 family protein [Salinibaculum rarum]|uniref:DUF7285 family protein n=1 Tax=Salinibaculum rarum TaxID=3058903 RepID=UPI00265F1F5C|nr:hypothetical protein [Salinibaculum sp. KK48]